MRLLIDEKRKLRLIRLLVCLLVTISFSTGLMSCSSSNGDNGTTDPVELPPVVFLADKEVAGKIELYATFNSGTNVIKISDTGAGGQVSNFQISPDGIYVAYRSDLTTVGIYELFVTAVDGAGGTVKVSGALAPGTSVESDFAWSADSAYIAFRKKEDDTSGLELFTVEPDGTNNTRVSGELVPGEMVTDFAWAPDGSRVAYRADQNFTNVFDLFSSLPDGNGNAQASLCANELWCDIIDYAWSPDSRLLAYRSTEKLPNTIDLFTNVVGLNPINNITVSNNGLIQDREVSVFAWAPNSSWLAYVANQNSAVNKDLYATLPDQTGSNKLTILGVNQNVEEDIAISPNSDLVAYRANQDNESIIELYTSTPAISGLLLKYKISGDLTIGQNVVSFKWSPNGSRIAYLADQDITGVFELYTTASTEPVDDIKVNPDLSGGKDVIDDYVWSPDSSLVAYRANQDDVNTVELYSSTPNASINSKVSGTINAANGNVQNFKWEQAGLGIAYRANQDETAKIELYQSLPDGTDNEKISGTITPPDGDVGQFDWVP